MKIIQFAIATYGQFYFLFDNGEVWEGELEQTPDEYKVELTRQLKIVKK